MLKNKNIYFKWIIYEFENLYEKQIISIKENFLKSEYLIKKYNQFDFLNKYIFIIIFKKFQNVSLIKDNIKFYKEKNIFDLNVFIINFKDEDNYLNEVTINKYSFKQNNNFMINTFKSNILKNLIKSMKESELLKTCLTKIMNNEKIKNIKKNDSINKK